jgi:hypothetical protein
MDIQYKVPFTLESASATGSEMVGGTNTARFPISSSSNKNEVK